MEGELHRIRPGRLRDRRHPPVEEPEVHLDGGPSVGLEADLAVAVRIPWEVAGGQGRNQGAIPQPLQDLSQAAEVLLVDQKVDIAEAAVADLRVGDPRQDRPLEKQERDTLADGPREDPHQERLDELVAQLVAIEREPQRIADPGGYGGPRGGLPRRRPEEWRGPVPP